MRKVIIVVLSVVSIITGSVLLKIYFYKGDRSVPFEEVIPGDPLFYVHFKNPETSLMYLQNKEFVKRIGQIDFEKVITSTAPYPVLVSYYQAIKKFFASSETMDLLRKVLGKEFAIAVYSSPSQKDVVFDISKLLSDIVFITRLSEETKLMETLSSRLLGKSEELKTEEINYQGYLIHIIKTEKSQLQIGYVRIRDILIFGFGDTAAKRAVDVYYGEKSAFSIGSAYGSLRENSYEGSDVTAYLNSQMFIRDVKTEALKLMTLIQTKNKDQANQLYDQFKDEFKSFQGFQSVILSLLLKDPMEAKTVVLMDKAKMSDAIKPLYQCKQKKNDTLAFVPATVLAYQWTSCYDFGFYWQQSLKAREESALDQSSPLSASEFVSAIESNLGLSIDNDIVPVLGNEVGGYLADIETSGLIPFPKILFFIETKDEAKAFHVVNTLIEKQLYVRPQREKYGLYDIYYVTVPLLAGIEPSYAFLNKYLLVSSHKELLQKSMDVFEKKGPSLGEDEKFQLAQSTYLENGSFLLFLHLHEFTERAQRLVTWGNQWAGDRTEEQDAFISGSLKRLEDLKTQLALKGAEIEILTSVYDQFQKNHQNMDISQGALDAIDASVANNEKFIQSIKDTITRLEADEKSGEGRNNLTEIEDHLKDRRMKLESLMEEGQTLKEKRTNILVLIAERAQHQAALDRKNQEIAELRVKVKEIEDLVAAINDPKNLSPRAQELLMKDFLSPLLRAMSSLQILTVQSLITDDKFETVLKLKAD